MARLIIVEDNHELAALIASAAQARGHTVILFQSGKAAMAAIQPLVFDAAIVDLLLPDIRGVEVLARLREARIPAVVTSGVFKGDIFATEAIHIHGARAFFDKPFELRELLGAVEAMIAEEEPPTVHDDDFEAVTVTSAAETLILPPPEPAEPAPQEEPTEPPVGPDPFESFDPFADDDEPVDIVEEEPDFGEPTESGSFELPFDTEELEARPISSDRDIETIELALSDIADTGPHSKPASEEMEEAFRRAAERGPPPDAPAALALAREQPAEQPADRDAKTPLPKRRPLAMTGVHAMLSVDVTPPPLPFEMFLPDAASGFAPEELAAMESAIDQIAPPAPVPAPKAGELRALAPKRRKLPQWSQSGVITQGCVVRLLTAYHQARHSGQLAMRHGEVEKALSFEQGRITHASSNVPEERFAAFAGKMLGLSAEELATVQHLSKALRLRASDVMLRMEMLTAAQRQQVLERQVKEILWSLFDWDSGEYAFSEEPLSGPELVPLELSTAPVVLEGVRELYDLDGLRERVPESRRLVAAPDPSFAPEELGLTDAQRRLLDVADGTKSVTDLLALVDLDEREVLTLLHAWELLGVVVERTAHDARRRITFGL